MAPSHHTALWLIYLVFRAQCAADGHQSVQRSPSDVYPAQTSPAENISRAEPGGHENSLVHGANASQGVLLWSLGRCATGTLGDTLVASGARYCKGRKESFSKSGVSETGLQHCLFGRGVVVAHIKPQHVWLTRSSLRAPEELMVVAAKVGFSTVVVLRRQNHLARLVSSFENRLKERRMQVDKARKLAQWFFATPRRTIEWESAMLEIGAQSAMTLGFAHVIQLDFHDVTASLLCSQVERIFELLGQSSAPCVPTIAHMSSPSKRSRPLEKRVGSWAARRIFDDLVTSPYEWMLELNATVWPATLPRPDPVLHPEGPRPDIEPYLNGRRIRRRHNVSALALKNNPSSTKLTKHSNSSTLFVRTADRQAVAATEPTSNSSSSGLRLRRNSVLQTPHLEALLQQHIVTFRV